MEIKFSKLNIEDFDLLFKWLNTPEIKTWYGNKEDYSSYELIYNKYIKYVNKYKPVNSFIIILENIKIGYIQYYCLKDYPEYKKFFDNVETSVGIDLFIGEIEFIGKGYGAKILNQFIVNEIFIQSNIKKIILGTDRNNKRAIKAYEKSGFKYVGLKKFDNDTEEEYFMELLK